MVKVTVTDTAGFWASAMAQVSATQGADAPVAFLSVRPTFGAIPLDVTADASQSADNDATPIQSYTFDFGDGSPSVGPQPGATATHTYSVAGTYTITVTVTDTGGLSSTATAGIRATGNLIGNPGFESDTAGWSATPATASLSRVAGGHSGAWSAQVTNTGTTAVSCALNDSPNWVAQTVAGTYTGTAWLWSDRIGAPVQLRFKEYVGSKVVHTQLARGKLNGGWQQLSLTYTVTAPGSTLDFNVIAQKAPPGTCFLADDLAITSG
jgi:PKD repeat protein